MRVTPSELREHRTREDAWSVFSGKVYNITPFLPFHPGGEKELMRVAGRDGTKLFGAYNHLCRFVSLMTGFFAITSRQPSPTPG